MKTLVFRSIFLFLIILFLGFISLFTYALTLRLSSEKMWQVLNDWRAEEGLKPWIKDENLCQLAETRAKEMNQYVDYSHNRFNERFTNGEISKTFNTWSTISENIGTDFSEKNMLYGGFPIKRGWLNSPRHAEALRADYTYSCAACDKGYCVQLFMK